MTLNAPDIHNRGETRVRLHPRDILALAFENFSPRTGISLIGAEDVVLVDLAVKISASFRVFSLDTGQPHPETYRFVDRVREHYGIPIEIFLPRSEELETFVRENGVPYNALHEREARWWWEDATKKECGLHAGNALEPAPRLR